MWPLAVVTEATVDQDGLVRRVQLRNAAGRIYERETTKLVLLEGELDQLAHGQPTVEDVNDEDVVVNPDPVESIPAPEVTQPLPSVDSTPKKKRPLMLRRLQ